MTGDRGDMVRPTGNNDGTPPGQAFHSRQGDRLGGPPQEAGQDVTSIFAATVPQRLETPSSPDPGRES